MQLDLLGFPSVLCERVHKQVAAIPADKILIGSTHTHSAGLLRVSRGRWQALGRSEVHGLRQQPGRGGHQPGLDSLQPAQLKIATGEAKGKIAYNYYAPELYDPR